tara:strand:+ start:70 stop:282 length:213 start_codon:yes stop_codon:yes gene_type:complete
MSNVIENKVLTKIETKLDKLISDLENIKDNKLLKIIYDLEGIKQIIILNDLERMSGQIKWLNKKESKNEQ